MSVPKSYGLRTAWEIRHRQRFESLGLVVHGPRGYGKTSFCVHAAAEALVPYMEKPDYDLVKKWILFTPQEFCDRVINTHTKQMLLIWDDAGYWLNRLFWQEQFVKEALRYMTLARTQFGAILFNTPSITMLPNKILELPDVFRAKVTKPPGNTDEAYPNIRWRDIEVRSVWHSDDLSKKGTAREWADRFSMFMPESFFKWYEPIRTNYLEQVKVLLRAALEKSTVLRKMPDILEDQLGKTLASPEAVRELAELNKQLS